MSPGYSPVMYAGVLSSLKGPIHLGLSAPYHSLPLAALLAVVLLAVAILLAGTACIVSLALNASLTASCHPCAAHIVMIAKLGSPFSSVMISCFVHSHSSGTL